ncbi:hypothetical protein MtrunA17_Chr4g0055701 [Medicago truncatula]|uniref:Uncharacterized protein n=1 Tax=Medicago truncatula TaxID=3880 RepID=A0A396IC92_MEDTR|nr:hypothetical protein MtrunA17_Chr4g0055701 [Medicago truncatula]
MSRFTSSITDSPKLGTWVPFVLYKLRKPHSTLAFFPCCSSVSINWARIFSAHSRHVAVPRREITISLLPNLEISLLSLQTATYPIQLDLWVIHPRSGATSSTHLGKPIDDVAYKLLVTLYDLSVSDTWRVCGSSCPDMAGLE